MAGYLRIIYSFSGCIREIIGEIGEYREKPGNSRGKSLEDIQGIWDNRG